MTWAALRLLLRRVPWTTWLMGAGVAAAIGYHLYARHEAYQAGEAAARAEIQQANDEARRKADDATNDVANCRGRWDRTSGRCVPDGGAGR